MRHQQRQRCLANSFYAMQAENPEALFLQGRFQFAQLSLAADNFQWEIRQFRKLGRALFAWLIIHLHPNGIGLVANGTCAIQYTKTTSLPMAMDISECDLFCECAQN